MCGVCCLLFDVWWLSFVVRLLDVCRVAIVQRWVMLLVLAWPCHLLWYAVWYVILAV